jgi:hypothetical protein
VEAFVRVGARTDNLGPAAHLAFGTGVKGEGSKTDPAAAGGNFPEKRAASFHRAIEGVVAAGFGFGIVFETGFGAGDGDGREEPRL